MTKWPSGSLAVPLTPPPPDPRHPHTSLNPAGVSQRQQGSDATGSNILSSRRNKSGFFLLRTAAQASGCFQLSLPVSLSGHQVVDDPRAAVGGVVERRVGVVEGRGAVLRLLDGAGQQVREAETKPTGITMQEVNSGEICQSKSLTLNSDGL